MKITVLFTVIKNLIIDPFQFFPGIVLSAFYYGYIVTQLPGGILARKFGGATILGLSVGTSGALTMLTPLAARAHVGVLIALRVVIGMAEVTNILTIIHRRRSEYCRMIPETKSTGLFDKIL